MEIIEISLQNFEKYKVDLAELNDRFLEEMNTNRVRTAIEKEAILKNMIREDSPTHLLAVININNKLVGFTYFNEGAGYSCGGNYVWLNSIYVMPSEQQKGYGSALLKYVEDWAQFHKCTLLISSRHINNKKSEKLFSRGNYEQEENINITNTLTNK